MSKGFSLIPLYDTNAVLKTWHLIQDGLEKVLNASEEDVNDTKVLNDILSGRLLLWIGFVDGVYAGFVTTLFHQVPEGPKYLWIVHAFKKVKVSSEFLLWCLERLEEFAVLQDCQYVKFYGRRRPWQEKLQALGYRETYVEFLKPMKEKESEDPNQGSDPAEG